MRVRKFLSVLLSMVILLSISTTGVFAKVQNDFVVQAEQVNNEKAVRVSWKEVSNVDLYTVYRTAYTAYGDIDMQTLEKLADVEKNTYSYVDYNVDWYDSYYYFVCAKNGDNQIMSSNEASAFVVNPTPVFENEAHIEEVINKIFTAKEKEIATHIKEQRSQPIEDKYLTLHENCGPTSIALQKVLADLGIYCEIRRTVYSIKEEMGMTHEYCLMRVNYGDDYSQVHNLIIDPTNRQYLRESFERNLENMNGYEPSEAEIDYALLNSGLPAVLVFEYSNRESAGEKVKAYLNKGIYGESFYDDFCDNAYENNLYSYPEQTLMMCYDRGVNSKQFKAIKELGKLNQPYDNDLYISTSWSEKKIPLEYKSNGIYQCYIPLEKLPDYKEGVQETVAITDADGNIIYGSDDEKFFNVSLSFEYGFMPRTQMFLNSKNKSPIKWVINKNSNFNIVVQIDMRAGVDNPLISAYPANEYKYGDINLDGDINILDATLLQMYVAKNQTLDTASFTAADVYDNGELNIKNVTEIQSYVAAYKTESNINNSFHIIIGYFIDSYIK